MARSRMHENEITTDVDLVRRLLAAQQPQWARLPIELVESYGTDHDIYRLGGTMCVRLPRIAWAAGQAAKEGDWLPRLAPHLPLAVPVQLALGAPGEGYPFAWSVCSWLPGVNANGSIADLGRAAVDLAAFILALRAVPVTGAPLRATGARGAPLAELDASVRRALAALGDRINAASASALWEIALAAPTWAGIGVWV
ncbi:MAG: Aminoglycoside phosphotransferase, partial [Jatrophihabitantaceae bacterium]|nr:Aminoglycoside phosphotransferase [Jatrophihabitantaceae bacterium]